MEKRFNLYIGTRDGKKELIGKNYTEQECNKARFEYRKIHYPEHKYYIRENKLTETVTEIDFGSYSDFFYVEEVTGDEHYDSDITIKEERELAIADTINSLKIQDFDNFRQFLKWIERQREIKEIRYTANNNLRESIIIGSFSINNFVWLISISNYSFFIPSYFISALNGQDTFKIIYNKENE